MTASYSKLSFFFSSSNGKLSFGEKISIRSPALDSLLHTDKKRRPRWFTLRICFKPVSYQPSHAAEALSPRPHGVPWTPHLPVSALAFLAASSLLLLLLLSQSPVSTTQPRARIHSASLLASNSRQISRILLRPFRYWALQIP